VRLMRLVLVRPRFCERRRVRAPPPTLPMMESFWGTLQLEVLDSRTWETRDELVKVIFEWIECWYNTE